MLKKCSAALLPLCLPAVGRAAADPFESAAFVEVLEGDTLESALQRASVYAASDTPVLDLWPDGSFRDPRWTLWAPT